MEELRSNRRRRFQFRLRSLFTIIGICAVVCWAYWTGWPSLRAHFEQSHFALAAKRLKPGMTQDEIESQLVSEGLNCSDVPTTEWVGDWGFFRRDGRWFGVLGYDFKSATFYVRYAYPRNAERPRGPVELVEIYRTGPTMPHYSDRQRLAWGKETDTGGLKFELIYADPPEPAKNSQN